METLRTLPGSTSTVSVCLVDASVLRSSPRVAELNRLLDWLGAESSSAQKLPAIITTAARVASDVAQRVYVAVEAGSLRPLGFIKVGQRTLFVSVPAMAAHSRLSDPSAYVASLSQQRTSGARSTRGSSSSNVARVMGGVGSLWEMTPLCLLDFFVTEESRRRGVGRILFDTMMGAEGVLSSAILAYVSRFFYALLACLSFLLRAHTLSLRPPTFFSLSLIFLTLSGPTISNVSFISFSSFWSRVIYTTG
jgi:hypothetical protein